VSKSYLLYGLHVAADHEIPGLLATSLNGPPDLRVHFSEWPSDLVSSEGLGLWFPSPLTTDPPGVQRRVFRSHSGDLFLITYPDGTEFAIDLSGCDVWVKWQSPMSVEDVVTYLVGPVVGFLLRWRGQLCLHAGCVRVGRAALAIAGSGGAGKSTTVSSFALSEYSVLSDDITPITERDGVTYAVPGYPRLCLWPESAAALFGHPDALPNISPSWDKKYFAVGTHSEFELAPVPLGAIYVLGDRSESDTAPRVEPLSQERAFVTLLGHSYANNWLDSAMRAAEFRHLDRLVRRLPIRLATPHAEIARLPQLRDAIVADFNSLHETAA
jgi:hypothetical protein